VQVVVEPAQVWQLEFHITHVFPISTVFPVSQALTHVFVLKSNLLLPVQAVQNVVVPKQVLQLESQGMHCPIVSF